jgi:hypothetical protein
MPPTVIRGKQVLDGSIQRADLDIVTAGQAVVAKLLQGTNVALSSTGADSGTGDVTINAPDSVSTDTGNLAVLGSDSHISVPTSSIWNVRLRSYNSISNCNFETDQKLCGATITASGTFSGPIIDRWYCYKAGTGAGYCAQVGAGNVVLPGTNFVITTHGLLFNTTTTQASLAATDTLRFAQQVEGSQMRELIGDVDNPTTKSIVYLCTYNAAPNTPQLITIPNIPVWASGGNWSTQPGNLGYFLEVTLACGSTYLTSPGAWANGTFLGATAMDNFLSNAVNSQFVLRFVQHEPGSQCSQLMDLPFSQNYDQCLRLYCKSYDYATKPGTITNNGAPYGVVLANQSPQWAIRFPRNMAKVPTVAANSPVTGAANTVRDVTAAVDRGISSFIMVGEGGFSGMNLGTVNTGVAAYYFHYTADTGW